MTEQEWLTSSDPQVMLDYLLPQYLPGASLPGDGYVTPRLISNRQEKLFADAAYALGYCFLAHGEVNAEHMVACVKDKRNGSHAPTVAAILRDIVGNPFRPVVLTDKTDGPPSIHEFRIQAGVPFTIFRRHWLTPTVLAIARAVHDDQNWDEMPILADALEEAGCPIRVETQGPEILTNTKDVCPYCSRWPENSPHGENGWVKCTRWLSEIPGDDYGRCDKCNRLWKVGYDTVAMMTYPPHPLLEHCRSGGHHVRGCWVVDLVLGKE